MKKLFLFTAFIALSVFISCNNTKKQGEHKYSSSDVKGDSILPSSPKNPVDKSALPFIEGEYTTNDKESGCKISLSIFSENGELKYKLKTDKRKLSDKAVITEDEDENGKHYYINFINMPWDEYRGPTDGRNATKPKKSFEVPKYVDGEVFENEITIQNDGNNMNAYTKIAECGLKYIHLVRK